MTRRLRTASAFIFTMAICLTIIVPAIVGRVTAEQTRVEQLNLGNTLRIREAISTPINQISVVSSYIEKHQGDLSGIDDLAAIIVEGDYVRNLILAPDGIVTHVYPDTEDNRNVLGLDYYSDSSEGNREAVISAQKKQLLLAGPFTTVVGDQAISGRTPVFITNEENEEVFWGLVSITMEYPALLEGSHLETLEEQGITYELWRENVDTGDYQVIFSNGVIDTKSDYIDKPVGLLNAEWHLRLGPVTKWYMFSETWAYMAIALFISAIVAFAIQKNYDLKKAKDELENIVQYDHLTGILNRQGMFNELRRLTDSNRIFHVNYIDLDRFKDVNDKFGHATGDLVLAEFARRMGQHIGEKQIFARMSGDEFIVIDVFDHGGNVQEQTFWDDILNEFKRPVLNIRGEDIYISFSRGSSVFEGNSDALDLSVLRADEQMYIEKNKKRNKTAQEGASQNTPLI